MRRPVMMFVAVLAVVPVTSARAQFTVPQTASAPDPATVFVNQCGTCHSAKQVDTPRQGPNLFGVIGRPAGTLQGFKYSPGFAQADFAWDEARLDAYLANPQTVIKGGVMAYRQANATTRKTIIAWLKEQH